MIDLHYVPSGNNLKIGIALEELGLRHRLVRHDMFGGSHQKANHFCRYAPEARTMRCSATCGRPGVC
jgi:glutathione S-transferase